MSEQESLGRFRKTKELQGTVHEWRYECLRVSDQVNSKNYVWLTVEKAIELSIQRRVTHIFALIFRQFVQQHSDHSNLYKQLCYLSLDIDLQK